jgi:hypothetical protein
VNSVQSAIQHAPEPKVAMTFERGSLTLETQDKESQTIPLSFDGWATVTINPAHLTDVLEVLDAGTSLSIHLDDKQPVIGQNRRRLYLPCDALPQ